MYKTTELNILEKIPLESIPSSAKRVNFLMVQQHQVAQLPDANGNLKESIYRISGTHWVIAGDDPEAFFVIDPGWLENKKGNYPAVLSEGQSPNVDHRGKVLPRLDFPEPFEDGNQYVWFVTDVISLSLEGK